MVNGKTVLGVIPARGGSKRFPRKNIAPFRGLPLIEWTIRAAERSEYIDTLICSTDDAEIALIATSAGCHLLHRHAELATDTAISEDVLRHALSIYPADIVVLLQPTSPLRTTADIDACIRMFHVKPIVSHSEKGRNGAVYVCSSQHIDFTDNIQYQMPTERSLDIDYKEQLTYSGDCYQQNKAYLDDCAERNKLVFKQLENGDYALLPRNRPT